MATATKVYPLASAENGQPLSGLSGVPALTTEVATKAEAEALVATGHFTLNPNDPRRIPADESHPPADESPPPADPAPES